MRTYGALRCGRVVPALASIALTATFVSATPAAHAVTVVRSAPVAAPSSSSPTLTAMLVTALPQHGPAVWSQLDGIGAQLVMPFNEDLAIVSVPVDEVGALTALPGVASATPMNSAPAIDAKRPSGPPFSPMGDAGSLWSVAQTIGATGFWQRGYTGQNVDVAVIDTGVAPLPQLAGRLVNGPDLSFDAGREYAGGNTALDGIDAFGHGTHIAGIIAGRDPGLVIPSPNPKHGVAARS